MKTSFEFEAPRAMEEKEFFYIATTQLTASPTNPRKYFDKDQLEELARNIKQQGVVEPLIVRHKDDQAKFEIVAGERRWRAAKIAKLAELPCRVRTLTDREVLEIQLTENLERRDLSAIEEAEGFAALIELSKKDGGESIDVAAVAKRIGKSLSYVYQRVKLTDLIEPLKKLLAKGEITAGHAILLARLTPQIQAEIQEKHLKNGYSYMGGETFVSVRTLAKFIQEKVLLKLHAAPFDKKMADLVPAAGACTTCPKRTGYVPELWADPNLEIKDQDTCSDVVCYNAKNAAWIEHVIALMEAEGKTCVRLSQSYGAVPAGALEQAKWRLAEKPPKKVHLAGANQGVPCAKSIFGIFVDDGYGQDFARGKVVKVCIDSQCPKHWGPGFKGAKVEQDKYKQEQAAKEKLIRARREARGKTIDAMLAAMDGTLGISKKVHPKVAVAIQDHELALLLDHLVRAAHHDELTTLFKRHGSDAQWEVPEGKKGSSGYSLGDWLKKQAAKWTDLKRWKVCVEMMLIPATQQSPWEGDQGNKWRDQLIKSAADGYGVQVVKPVLKEPKAKPKAVKKIKKAAQ